MKKISPHSKRFLAVMALGMALLTGHTAPAAAPEAVPLVTIRFNQPQVRFEQPLHGALAKALSVKSDLMLDIVSYAPQTGNTQVDQQWQTRASRNTRKVIAAMVEMGVPLHRIHVTGKIMPGLQQDETRIFVR